MDYTTQRGSQRRQTPADDYADLLDQDTYYAPDDGAIILHVGDPLPICADCGSGRLQWAEAGYVPWHRICDICGSHWDLHPLGMGIALLPVTDPAQQDLPPSARRIVGEQPAQWIDGPGWVPLSAADPIQGADGHTWGELIQLVDDTHRRAAETLKVQTMGVPCVAAYWARRARFY